MTMSSDAFPCLHCAICTEINQRAADGLITGEQAGKDLALCIANMIENAPAELRERAMVTFFAHVRNDRARIAAAREGGSGATH